jgi:signal transduction histidine kinase
LIRDIKIRNYRYHEIVQSIIDIIHLPDHITVSIISSLPRIKADKFRIQQLFQNLIGNAVNYIDKEQGLVEVAATQDGDTYVFSIKDNGVGMPKEIHSKIFETFKSFTTSKHSTGLAYQCKKIITFYNGEIWLESRGYRDYIFCKIKKIMKIIQASKLAGGWRYVQENHNC